MLNNAQAQLEQKIPLGLNVMFGRMYTKMESRGFNQFVESYNAAYNGFLTTELAPIKYEPGTFWGLGITASMFNIDILWENTSGYSEAAFTNGTARVWNVDERTTSINFGLLFPIGVYAKVGMYMGMIDRKGTFSSGFRYPDGYVSYGIEKRLNGIYHLHLGSNATFGLQANAGFKYGFIYAKWERVGILYNETTQSELPIKDKHGGQGVLFNNYTLNSYHVDDIANAQNEDVFFAGLQGQVLAAVKGSRAHIGIAIFIGHYFDYDDAAR
ncbi:MAG: hypothetical protein KDC92_10005 [Bacteroidetes bacterium]|nr:hypothetical protein [Bacteroidota bacterium]